MFGGFDLDAGLDGEKPLPGDDMAESAQLYGTGGNHTPYLDSSSRQNYDRDPTAGAATYRDHQGYT